MNKVDRRTILAAMGGALILPAMPAFASLKTRQVASDIKLRTSPKRVFWATDFKSPEGIESCYFHLIVPSTNGAAPSKINVELFAADASVKEIVYGQKALESVEAPVGGGGKFKAYRIIVREPMQLKVDRISITVQTPEGQLHWDVKPEHYTNKTNLILPFKGPGLIMQSWVNDSGHANASGQFAVDFLALTDMYAPQVDDKSENASYAGWGKQLLVPGDGVIVHLQDGIPNQIKPEVNDEKAYTLPDGTQSSHGNHVVIDHKNGEFSVVAHMQPGSLQVKMGDTVKQGDPLGKLGNSGNTFGPHVHFQLQDGVKENASALPYQLSNVKGTLYRGRYFTAK